MLDEDQKSELITILSKAFPARVQFEMMLDVRLGRSLDSLATTNALETDIYYVVRAAEAQGWTRQLINAARESRPGVAALQEFAQQFDLTPVKKTELELVVKAGKGFLDVATWRSSLGMLETRICRIELPLKTGSTSYGTGFLVAPDKILTNYHVMELIDKGLASPENVVVRFDYKRLEDGVTLNSGTVYKLAAENWKVAASKYSDADKKGSPKDAVPSPDELDFCLVKLKGSPGNDKVGRVVEDKAPPRGYIALTGDEIEIKPGDPLLILQHPEGDYLKLGMDTEGSLNFNSNKTRLRYATNTLKGSSGSPCFNINWKLVALHHAGDPNYSELHPAEYNQGIPIHLIYEKLALDNLAGELGAPPADDN
jgi:hypothetical protein